MKRYVSICLALLVALQLWGGEAVIGLRPDGTIDLAWEAPPLSLSAAVRRGEPCVPRLLWRFGDLAVGDWSPKGAARLLLGGGVSGALPRRILEPGGALSGIVLCRGRLGAFCSGPLFRAGAPSVLGAVLEAGGVLWGAAVSEAEPRKAALTTDWATRFPGSPLLSLMASRTEASGPLEASISAAVFLGAKTGLRRSLDWSLAWKGPHLAVAAARALSEGVPSALRPDGNPRPAEEASLEVSSASSGAEALCRVGFERGRGPLGAAVLEMERRLSFPLGGASLALKGRSVLSSDARPKEEARARLSFEGGSAAVEVRDLEVLELELRLGGAVFSTDLAGARCSITHTRRIGDGELKVRLSEDRKVELSYSLSLGAEAPRG